MLPDFDEIGNLPPGTHAATLDEVTKRFSRPSYRKRGPLTRELVLYVGSIESLGPVGLYQDGSYVTKKLIPSDIDLGVVFPPDFDLAGQAWRFKGPQHKTAGLDIQLFGLGWNEVVMENILNGWTTHRETGQRKGMVYVELM